MRSNCIMGLDLSTSCTGYSIFDKSGLIAYGKIKPKNKDWRERIEEQAISLGDIMRKYHPIKAYVEDVPLKPGSSTLVKLGAMQGMILALCSQYSCKPIFLLPVHWRKELDLYDGTRQGLQRDILKQKAVQTVNDEFGIRLNWVSPKSKLNDDDIAEGILIAYSQIVKYRRSQENKSQ